MKQKQHCTEAIIRILRQSEGDETVSRSAASTTSRKRRSIAGSANKDHQIKTLYIDPMSKPRMVAELTRGSYRH